MELNLMPDAEAVKYDSRQQAGQPGTSWLLACHNPWPRSASFWMVAFYMVLFLIRPWEVLYPWMADYPIERTFAILTIATIVHGTIATIVLGGHFWFRFTGQTMTILAFLGAVSLSALYGLDPANSWDQLYKYITVLVWYFLFNSVIRTPSLFWPWRHGGCSCGDYTCSRR